MSILLHLRLRKRMGRVSLLLFVSGVLCMPYTYAAISRRHDSKRSERRQIEDLEEQWRKALINDDVALADDLLAEDFVGISMTGQANTKSQQLDRLRNRRLVITKMDLSDSKVKLVGTIAIVTTLAQIEGMNEGVSMQGTYRYTRIYQRLPSGAWKTTNFEATRVPVNRRD